MLQKVPHQACLLLSIDPAHVQLPKPTRSSGPCRVASEPGALCVFAMLMCQALFSGLGPEMAM